MMLIKFPGDPARAGLPRFHSFNVRGAGVGAKEVPVIASSCGEIVGFPFDDGVAIGLSSGDWRVGDELSEVVPLALPFLVDDLVSAGCKQYKSSGHLGLLVAHLEMALRDRA